MFSWMLKRFELMHFVALIDGTFFILPPVWEQTAGGVCMCCVNLVVCVLTWLSEHRRHETSVCGQFRETSCFSLRSWTVLCNYKAWHQRSDNTDLEMFAWRTCTVRFQNKHCWCSLQNRSFFLQPFPYPLLLGKDICLSFPSLRAACKSCLNKHN